MSKSSIFLQPAYSLTGEVFDKVNLISGSSFDNGLVSLFFDGEISLI
ncbi:hypothetical protein [Vibrio cholerae]